MGQSKRESSFARGTCPLLMVNSQALLAFGENEELAQLGAQPVLGRGCSGASLQTDGAGRVRA